MIINIFHYTLMVKVTMDFKIQMYVEILLERQLKKNKKQKMVIPQSLIQDAQ